MDKINKKIIWEDKMVSAKKLLSIVHDLAYIVDWLSFEREDEEQYHTGKPRYEFYENKILHFLIDRWIITRDDI